MTVNVIGGGVIGLGLAGELARDHKVRLFDRGKCGRGASHAAAGMLGPVMEVEFREPELLELGLESHRMYEEFVSDLEQQTGQTVDLQQNGTIYVAVNEPDVEEMNRLYEYQHRVGLKVERKSPEQVRELEPRVTNYVSEGMYTVTDQQVDNRKLVSALFKQCENRDVEIHEQEPVTRIEREHGTVSGVRTGVGEFEADVVILTAGAESTKIEGVPKEDGIKIRPVKGQALSIELSDPPEIQHVIRTPDVYCVPKPEGRMVVGSTMEEEGFDTRVTAGGVLDLLHKAYEVLPFVYEQTLLETWAGLRPASKDSLPVMGPSPHLEGLVYGTGHYRNGILLTPITIELITSWIRSNEVPELLEPFLPARFSDG